MTLLAFLLACDGGPSTDDPTDGPTDTGPTGTPDCVASFTDGLGAGPSFDLPDGEIRIENEPAYPWLQGEVADGPLPRLHHETDRDGACRLVEYTPSTCSPACTLPDLCVDGACVPFPARADAGTLTVTGEDIDLDVAPDGTLAWFAELPTTVVGAVTASAAGGEVPAFSVGSCEVTAPAPTGDWAATLAARAAGQDVALTWGPVDPDARVSLRMTTGVATHGGVAHAEIECEGPDTGSLTLPGRFLDVLFSEGWACGECGDNRLYRYRAGVTDVDGREVRFTVRAATSFWYIPGRG